MSQNVEAVYPLSPLQRGMLFHTLLAPDSGTYFNQLHGVLEGNLDVNALDAAWQQAAENHTILRTAFAWEGVSEPMQAVLKTVSVPSTVDDWRGLSREQQQASLQEFLLEDRRRGFPLNQAPLMRAALMQLDDNRYQFVWSHHHLVMDAWSMALLLQEVFQCYGQLSSGQPVSVARARPYGDYVTWLRRQDLSASEAHWRSLLCDFHAPTPLPEGRSGPSIGALSTSGSAECYLHLSAEATAALQTLARTHQLTLNTLVQAAWGVLLSSSSGNPDVVFGSVTSTRPLDLPGADKMLGMFVNTLPVRVRMSSEPLLQWLKTFQNMQADSRQHQHNSLVDVQGWSGVPRNMPLFESVVVFENFPEQTLTSTGGLALEVTDTGAYERTGLPLTLYVAPGAVLSLKLMYETDRFDAASAQNALQHLANILTGMRTSLDRPVSELSMLSDQERHQLLVEFNRTATDYPSQPVHELFEACVENNPDAIALVHEGVSLPYAELNRRANRLAHHLQSLGVGPEVLVAVALDRSVDTVVAIFAILKAGGAYLPLDLSYPADRIAFMLGDSQAAVLVCSSSTGSALPVHSARAVVIDTDAALIAAQPDTNPVSRVRPDNRAYIIYTSGSTGRPKGVEIRHEAVSNFRSAMVHQPGMSVADTLLAITVFSFDMSVLELLVPFTAGVRVVLASRAASSDPAQLLALLQAFDITILQATPVTWRMLLDAGWTGNPRLKALCGAEALSPALSRTLAGATAELWNLYGPTETTVWSTCSRILKSSGSTSIGVPIANTEIYILDSELQPVPCGVAGELYIGGAGLARGYYHRPDLTAERFVPHPFSSSRGSRLYRTGDLACFRHDGSIDYLGRADHQVKIRGFRIEPGEIQARLAEHSAVSDALVLARQDRAGETCLVAYLIADASVVSAVSIDQLRRHLASHLPDYMIPSAFVFIEAFPLTPNGKIDRKALPAPDSDRPRLASAFRPPRSASEELLAGLFAGVLGVDRVGIDDSFFDLGGHSLLATQLVSRIRSAFRVDLPLRAIFDTPSVVALAERISTTAHAMDSPIVPTDRSRPIPASDQQRRTWLVDRLETDRSIHNTPVVLRIRGPLHRDALERSINEIVRRHEVMRTTLRESAGTLLQVIHPFVPFHLPIVDLTDLQPESRLTAAMEIVRGEMQKPFDLEKGPIFDGRLAPIEAEDNILYLNVHHVATDAWSLRIFLGELSALYGAFSTGQPSPLNELAVQYADFAAWQEGMMGSGAFESQLEYWREQFDLSTNSDEPTSPGPAASVGFALPEIVTEELGAFAQREGVTPYMVLLSAFHLLLRFQTETENPVVGMALSNRVCAETENMIGFFANTAALRARISDDMTARDLLELVRESVLTAFANQEAVPDSLRGVSRNGFERAPFSAWFAFDQGTAEIPIAGLSAEFISLPSPATSQLPLTLRLRQDQEGLSGSMEYREDIYIEDQALEMARNFETTLELLMLDPEQPVSELLSHLTCDTKTFSLF